jgi:hypothetical protein
MPDQPPRSSQHPVGDTTVPHSARVWNYWLGGQDNYPVDRAVGDQVRAPAGAPDVAAFCGVARKP